MSEITTKFILEKKENPKSIFSYLVEKFSKFKSSLALSESERLENLQTLRCKYANIFHSNDDDKAERMFDIAIKAKRLGEFSLARNALSITLKENPNHSGAKSLKDDLLF